MQTMHDVQRRALLRALFWLVCLLPTAAVGAWSYSLRTAGHRAAAEDRIGSALGMRVTLEAIRYPQPGLILLEGFRAYDPETDALVLSAPRVEAEPAGDGLQLAAANLEAFADAGTRLFGAVERRLKRELPDAETRIGVEIDQLTWHSGGAAHTLTHFEAVLGPTESGRHLLVNFRSFSADASVQAEGPASLRLARTGTTTGAETTVELDTGATPLPCAMFVPLVGGAADLGADARIDGRLKLKHAARLGRHRRRCNSRRRLRTLALALCGFANMGRWRVADHLGRIAGRTHRADARRRDGGAWANQRRARGCGDRTFGARRSAGRADGPRRAHLRQARL
ncbi:MAG: hypothetical protein QM775_23615 [Pirellulales bacterium]